jgi:hypothetical protein
MILWDIEMVALYNRKYEIEMVVSINGGTQIAGWFMDHGKSQSKMDDDWG